MPMSVQHATMQEGITQILQPTNVVLFVEMEYTCQQLKDAMTTILTLMMVVLQLVQLSQVSPARDR